MDGETGETGGRVAGFPRWEWWTGVNGLLYARRLRTSPPPVLRAGTYGVLLEQIRLLEREMTGWRPGAGAACERSGRQEDDGMSEPVTKSYRGRLQQHDYGDAMDVLFLDAPDDDSIDADEPVARRVADDMERHGSYLSVRYWTSGTEQPDDALRESAVRSLLGSGDGTEYETAYSDVTGYLWTDENIKVGGHDLLAELESHLGQWCLLEIDYSPDPAPQAGG